ncbi:MAG: pyroglutamyl-peptidase [Gammaproteobacteria bacterium]
MSPQRILVSGFEPFAGEAVNPSTALVEALRDINLSGVDLHTLILPVVRGVADDSLLAAIEALSPSHVLMFGEAGGRAQITPERVAVNVDDYRIEDNAGHQPRGEPVVRGGPVGYFSTLPIDAMVAAMNSVGADAAVSNSAGTFLCNRVFYRTMHHLSCDARGTRAGFVHLPSLHEQVPSGQNARPSMSLRVLVDAARQMIQVLARP